MCHRNQSGKGGHQTDLKVENGRRLGLGGDRLAPVDKVRDPGRRQYERVLADVPFPGRGAVERRGLGRQRQRVVAVHREAARTEVVVAEVLKVEIKHVLSVKTNEEEQVSCP